MAAPPGAFRNLTGDADDEEEETKGIPRNVAIPLRQICTRMGRVLPHLTQFDVSIYNYKIRDHTSIHPYLPRCENMDLRWPVSKGVRSEIAEHNVDFEGVAAAIKFAAFKKKTVKLSQEDLSKTSPPPKTKR